MPTPRNKKANGLEILDMVDALSRQSWLMMKELVALTHRVNELEKKGKKMPTPRNNETKDDFVKRFMASVEANRDYPDEKQRYAVALSVWKKAKEKK